MLANQVHSKEASAQSGAALVQIGQGDLEIHEAGFLDGFAAEFAFALGRVIGVDLFFACAEEAHDFLDHKVRPLAFLLCAHGGAWHGGAI